MLKFYLAFMTKKIEGKKKKMKGLKERTLKIIDILKKDYPNAKTALNFSNSFELLAAVMLSAQCTDVMVNKVTSKLFKKYSSVNDYAEADLKELENDIRSTGFFRQKAKNLQSCAKMLQENFKGKIPRTMDELTECPGVARKTANIVLYNAYGIVEGIAVDTHVKRLSQRLGLSKNKDAEKIESDLMALVPKEKWGPFSYLLIDHGRAVCKAKKPLCDDCNLADLCPKIGV